MAQEENVFGCSYGGGRSGGGGGGGSCRSKKIKPKKVPQRGLGVAQLEKIRIEEEQKQESLHILAKNGIAATSSSSSSPSPSDAASFLGVQKFRPNVSHFHNSPPPPPSSSNLSSPNALFRHSQSVPNIEILQESCSVSKGEIGFRAISSPRLWGGGGGGGGSEYNLALEKQQLDHHHHAFAFDPPPPHHFQPPPSSMVRVNSSSGISPSSVLTSHLEPPSNQSSRRSNYEEDKMVGMKRSYPFSLESPPPPSLHFRPSYAPSSSSRPDALALCSSGYTLIAESRNKCIRGSPQLEHKPNEVRDDERLNGEFLTLAPPSSNFKHDHSSQEYGRIQIQQPESSGSVRESFNFFPVKLSTIQRSNDARNGNGEEGGDVIDLNLKL